MQSKVMTVLIAGVVSSMLLIGFPYREVLPPIDLGYVVIEADADLPAAEMVARFTAPIEEVLHSLPGVKKTTSRTTAKHGEIQVELEEGVSSEIVQRIRDGAKGLTVPLKIRQLKATEGAMVCYLSGLEPRRLEAAAVRFGETLRKMPEVSRVSLSSNPPEVAVRFNGDPAIALSLTKQEHADVITFRTGVRAAASQETTATPGLHIAVLAPALDQLEEQLQLLTFAGCVGLVVLALISYGLYRSRSMTAGLVSLAALGLLLSLLGIRALGISLNFFSVLSFFAAALVSTSALMLIAGFFRRGDAEGIRPMILPLTWAVTAAAVSFMSFGAVGGIVGKILRELSLVAVMVMVISCTLFLIMTPPVMRSVRAPAPRGVPLYRRILSRVLYGGIGWRVLAWALPQAALLYMILFIMLHNGGFRFFKDDGPEQMKLWLACDADQREIATRRVEDRLLKQADIRRLVVTSGRASGKYHALTRYGPEYAEVEITLSPGQGVEPITRILSAEKARGTCDLDWDVQGPAGYRGTETIAISGDQTAVGEIAAALEAEVRRFAPEAVFHLERDGEDVLRRNGIPSASLFVEADDIPDLNALLIRTVEEVREAFPEHTLDIDAQDKDMKQSLAKGLSVTLAAILLIVIIHVLAGVWYRSFLPGVILFSPLYFIAGVFLAREVYMVSLFAVPVLPPILGIIVFITLQAVKEAGKPLSSSSILDCSEQLFRATLPLFGALFSSLAVVWITDDALSPFAAALLAGLLLLMYFVWVLLPLFLKLERGSRGAPAAGDGFWSP